jgi:glycosyltransferase involved in cell wall biosynthesis
MVVKKCRDVRFLIIGDGPERSQLDELASRYRIKPFVSFMGFRFDMDRIYSGLDVVVLSSYTEGFPKVILEALSYGKPVIATEVGGVPEIIRQNKTGLLIPPGSPALMADAMCDILDHPNKGDSLGRTGRDLVKTEFSIKARTRKLEQLYFEVCRNLG